MTIPRLESPRLVLRAFVPEDWPAHRALLADTEAMQHMHFTNWNDAQRREWFANCLASGQ